MRMLGLNTGYLLLQCGLLLLWLLFSLFALSRLRGQSLPETARALWAIFIVVVPFVGALAFLIVQPGTVKSGTD
jgi:tellurite resistance protein TehA-like permease